MYGGLLAACWRRGLLRRQQLVGAAVGASEEVPLVGLLDRALGRRVAFSAFDAQELPLVARVVVVEVLVDVVHVHRPCAGLGH